MTPRAVDILGGLLPPLAGSPRPAYRRYVEDALAALPCDQLTLLCRFFQCDIGALSGHLVRHQFEEAEHVARAARRKGAPDAAATAR